MANAKKKISKKLVVVRTYSAGVHVGELVSRKGKEAKLANARRIWRWRGANTLNEVATLGIEHSSLGWSRVSEPVAEVELTEAIEVLKCEPKAYESIVSCGWAK